MNKSPCSVWSVVTIAVTVKIMIIESVKVAFPPAEDPSK